MLMWWLNASTRQWISIQAVITAGFCKAERRFRYCHNFIRHKPFLGNLVILVYQDCCRTLDCRADGEVWALVWSLTLYAMQLEIAESGWSQRMLQVRRVKMSGCLQETHGIRSGDYPLIHRGIFLYWIWNSN